VVKRTYKMKEGFEPQELEADDAIGFIDVTA
jgi:hypothetical protein